MACMSIIKTERNKPLVTGKARLKKKARPFAMKPIETIIEVVKWQSQANIKFK